MNFLHPVSSAVLVASMAVSLPAFAQPEKPREAVRIEAATLPMLQVVAKSGSEVDLKPESLPRIPGPMLSIHRHLKPDGSFEEYCREAHGRVQLPADRSAAEQPR